MSCLSFAPSYRSRAARERHRTRRGIGGGRIACVRASRERPGHHAERSDGRRRRRHRHRRHRLPRRAAQRDREEEEFGNGRRIGLGRGHRQAARQRHRRIDRAPAGHRGAAQRRPRQHHLDPRLRPRFLDHDAERPPADHDQRQPRGRVRPISVAKSSPGVDVYKTAEADQTAGGLVGSIDLRTIRPLDVGKRVFAVGARGTYIDQKLDPNSSNKGYRAYATFVDKFADDRVGVALSAAYTNEPYQTRDFNAWGFGGYPGGAQGMNGIKTWVGNRQAQALRRQRHVPGAVPTTI